MSLVLESVSRLEGGTFDVQGVFGGQGSRSTDYDKYIFVKGYSGVLETWGNEQSGVEDGKDNHPPPTVELWGGKTRAVRQTAREALTD